MDLDDNFNFMFDFVYEFNHNFEIDFDLNIVVDSVFAVLRQGLRHPHIGLVVFSCAEDSENYGILLNHILDLKNLGFMSHDLFSKDFTNIDDIMSNSLTIAGQSF